MRNRRRCMEEVGNLRNVFVFFDQTFAGSVNGFCGLKKPLKTKENNSLLKNNILK